ncbi:UbiA family prenyltransferase [Paludibaculum fermentans]|uniref:UbiA family prenyltransferase n=1 Tax=Paludibaculum fermentans TaxID=1473598 RepID=UPI003EBE71D9
MDGSSASAPEFEVHARPSPFGLVLAAVVDLLALTKPEVNVLIVIATFAGFYLGCPNNHPFPAARLLGALSGTLLVASGTGALNQYLERGFDAQMRRTWKRPLAARRLSPWTALGFGITLSVSGTACLFVTVNALTSMLAVITLVSRQELANSVGAVNLKAIGCTAESFKESEVVKRRTDKEQLHIEGLAVVSANFPGPKEDTVRMVKQQRCTEFSKQARRLAGHLSIRNAGFYFLKSGGRNRDGPKSAGC